MSKIQNDKLIRETLIEETTGHKIFSSEMVITKEEFLACYNEWVLKPMRENSVAVQGDSGFCIPIDNNGCTPV